MVMAELTYEDYKRRLSIQELLVDAGYRLNRRDGLRYPSYVRIDSDGRRVRGDKFIVTGNGFCCFQPPERKNYNVISFIKEHPHFFAEYTPGMSTDRLVNLVCRRLLNEPQEIRETRIFNPGKEGKPFDIDEYDLQAFRMDDWESQKKFYPYFKNRGIDLSTQNAFHRHFCLATKHGADGAAYTCLAFPLTLPKEGGTVVGFEERERMRMDGCDSYKGKSEESNESEGLWIASPAGTPLAEAKHIYWFGSTYDAMAYYQLHQAKNKDLRKAVFISTGGKPIGKQMREILDLTIPARQHICFDNTRKGSNLTWDLQKEICRSVRFAIEETPERKPYLDSIPDGGDLTDGEFYLLPKGGLQEICIRFDAESEEAESMRSSGLCAPEDVQDQIDTTNKCYREYREKLREFLGIDREHDVSITWESPDYRHTSWNEQLLAEQKREETVGQESEKEENAGQERQILSPMTMPYTIQDVRNIILRPHAGQFVIDELPLIFMCMAGLVYGGMEGMPLGGMATVIALFLFLVLLYRFICLRRICYRVGNEQLVCERGLFCRRVDYMELYRIVDFQEHQSLLQQICGLKTVRILSMDRNTPRLDLIGVRCGNDIVAIIRERVEINKRKKGIYEITNH